MATTAAGTTITLVMDMVDSRVNINLLCFNNPFSMEVIAVETMDRLHKTAINIDHMVIIIVEASGSHLNKIIGDHHHHHSGGRRPINHLLISTHGSSINSHLHDRDSAFKTLMANSHKEDHHLSNMVDLKGRDKVKEALV